MSETSFKNYVVNYNLVVNSTATEGFTQVAQMAQRMQKPLRDISNHFKRLQQSASALKKGDAFEIKPTIDVATFDKQAQTLITRAEKVAAQVNAILNGAFTVNPAAAKTTGGKGTSGKKASSKTEERIYTTDQLKKEAEQVKKQLKNLYGPRGAMSENTKGYKSLLESLKGDVAKLADLKKLRTQLAAVNSDIKAAGKNGGKITKTITDGVAQGVIQGTKKGGKKLIQEPQVTEAFNAVLQSLMAGKAVQIPISVVSNAQTIESVNAAMAKMKGQIKPIVVPITVATNIDAAKAVRGTVEGLQNVIAGITPSATGTKGGAKVKKPVKPVLQTLSDKEQKEYKRLQDKLNPLYAKEDNYKKEMAAIQARSSGGMSEKDTKRFNKLKDDLLPKVQKRIGNIEPGFVTLQAKDRQYAVTYQTALEQYNQQLAAYKAQKAGKGGAKGTVIPKSGGVVLPISETIQQLQALATEKAITLNLQMAPISVAQTQLTEQIAALQTLANEKAILLNTTLTPKTAAGKKGRGKVANTGTTAAANAIPFEGVVENIVVSKSVKVSGGPVKVEGIVENVKAGKGMKPIELKANIVAPGLNNQVNVLRELSTVWKALPKTGSRTYTVNLKMPGIENIGRLRELVGIVGNMPASQRRVYNNGIGAGQGNRGTSTSIYAGGGRNASTRYMDRPKGTMNTFAYQLMGNTSLGARTPVFLDMMKGMGMMSGVGAAMSTLTNAFSNASEYQNTMVTARSILEAGYQGINFDNDFKNMERIVRDVAKKTKFTAPQAADAARFMAMAGLNIPMINASIRPIADVAVIGDNDLGEVADKITNIQTAFGLKPNQMRGLADALTKTFTSSNTDMMMLAESMEYAAPMAHLAGAKVEDALAMIGIMGNAGIQGSMAGTTLRMMYQNVINPNKKQQKMWQSLGISLKDASGNPRQLIDILSDLRKKASFSKDDKNLDGTWKDEGTPVAELVSKLFRVTASAGAGTLLENLDKVYALANANRNADGLSQRISEVKQNDVKGMWAKMTSAFTDAVVTEFESQESPIKGYIGNLIKYFNSPDFKDLLHDIFDLVTSMLDMLGTFAQIWKSIYNAFGPIIKYTMMAQFILAQIGYLLAPLRSVYLTIARGAGVLGGIAGGKAAMGAAGSVGAGVGSAGVMAASSAAPLLSFGHKKPNYNTPAIQAARTAAMQSEVALANSRKYLAAATALDAATTPGLRRSMEKKQMQWWVASQYAGTGYSASATETSLRSSDNRSGRWNLAYTNPQAASELPNRFKIMSAREREVAALQEQLRRRGANLSAAEAAVLANTASNINARRALNSRIADVRHGARRVDTAVLNRAVQMGKISRGKAIRMSLSSGFRTAATWGVTGASMMSLMNGFTTVVGFLGKVLGALVNPLTLLTGATIAAGVSIYKFCKQNNQWQEQIRISGKLFNKNLQNAWGATTSISDIFSNINTIHVGTASINVDNELKNAKPIAESEDFKFAYEALSGKINTYTDGILGTKKTVIKGVSRGTFDELYDKYIAPLIGVTPNLPSKESFNRYFGGGVRNTNEALAGAQIVRAMIGGQATTSDQYNKAIADLLQLASEYANKPLSERIQSYPDYIKSLQDVAEQFNPANKWGLSSVTQKTFQRDMQVAPNQYTEYWATAYNSIQRFIDESPALRAVQAIHALNTGVEQKTEQWWNNIMDIAGGIELTDDSYKDMGKITIPMKDGHVQFDKLKKILQDSGVKLANDVNTYIMWLHDIYEQMHKIEDAQSWLGNITEEEFLKRALGMPSLFNGNFFFNPYEQKIDDFLGLNRQAPSEITAPLAPTSKQFESLYKWNWFTGSTRQDAYKPQQNGPVAMTSTPTLHFNGPLIKIDSIKGGDGVTADELKGAVAEAVTNTMNMIVRPTPFMV